MDKETKKFFGRILGEVLRVQKQQGICCESNATIYGLLNGFENVVDDILEKDGISKAQVKAVADILEPYFRKKKELTGFYDIEDELGAVGVDRAQAIRVLTYFQAGGQFKNEIAKMDSDNSPTECRTFEAWPDDLESKD